MIKFTSTICVAFVALILANPAAAQQKTPPATDQAQSIKRIPLQRFDVPGTAARLPLEAATATCSA